MFPPVSPGILDPVNSQSAAAMNTRQHFDEAARFLDAARQVTTKGGEAQRVTALCELAQAHCAMITAQAVMLRPVRQEFVAPNGHGA